MARHRRPGSSVNGKTVLALLAALTAGATGLAQLLHTVEQMRVNTQHLEDQFRGEQRDTNDYRDRVRTNLHDLHRQVDDIPTDRPVRGPPGPAGPATTVVIPPAPRPVSVPPPASEPTPTPTPTPKCRTAVAGICLQPNGEHR